MTPALEHTMRVGLRWRDMDMLGHLNQSVYHELLEEARAALIMEIVRRVGTHTHGSFVLAHVDLDYHQEVRKDDEEVEITARVTRVGNSSLTVEHEISVPRRGGARAASGTTILVAWDPVARGKRTLSEAERVALGARA